MKQSNSGQPLVSSLLTFSQLCTEKGDSGSGTNLVAPAVHPLHPPLSWPLPEEAASLAFSFVQSFWASIPWQSLMTGRALGGTADLDPHLVSE